MLDLKVGDLVKGINMYNKDTVEVVHINGDQFWSKHSDGRVDKNCFISHLEKQIARGDFIILPATSANVAELTKNYINSSLIVPIHCYKCNSPNTYDASANKGDKFICGSCRSMMD